MRTWAAVFLQFFSVALFRVAGMAGLSDFLLQRSADPADLLLQVAASHPLRSEPVANLFRRVVLSGYGPQICEVCGNTSSACYSLQDPLFRSSGRAGSPGFRVVP